MGSSRGSRSTKNGSVMAEERRDPYEVLGVSRNATDQEIKTAYRKMALELHPDKNGNNPEAVELFKEVAYSYGILSDPEKRRHYDGLGFQGVELENMDMELDLSNLGTVNTVFAAIFSKLGVPIKTSVSPNILEDALSGAIQIRPLPLGHVLHDKVEKQGAHFYGLTISKTQAEAGIVIQVTSSSSSKFKLLYFEQEENGGYGLALQEDSMKSGKITSAGMYFLHFQVYRFDPTVNALALGKDPEAILFKCLEGLLPCEMSELKAGTHVFAVYGDNFFKSTSYSIEAICAESFRDATDYLREMESQMLEKRTALRQFENEYREAAARFAAVTNRYAEEKLEVTELLKRREKIHRLFTSAPQKTYTHSSSQKVTCDDSEFGSASQSPESEGKKKSRRKKWFGLKAKKPV